jgi:sec-independent protein translocase protein TatB
MFEVGFTEIVLIFAIALLVLGPARLPKLAADVGRWAGRARAMARQLRTQLEQEARYDPLRDEAPAPAPAATEKNDDSKPA